jgi:hypothetical protein
VQKLAVTVAFSIILIVTPLSASVSQAYLSPRYEPKEILFTSYMPINLVVVGDQWSAEDEEGISSQLLKSYRPVIMNENIPIGVEYRYNYTFVSAPDLFSTLLYTFIEDAAIDVDIPEPVARWVVSEHPEFGNVEEIGYRIVNAFDVEEWLRDNWEFEEGYTIFFFMPHGDELNYLHTYGMLTTDPDTGVEFLQEGMMGFGGTYRFYFIDLTAGPWVYPPDSPFCEEIDIALCDQVNHVKNKNIYDITSVEEIHSIVSDYVNNAVTLLFTPSYVYSPFYRTNHEISIFLVDFTAEGSSDSIDRYIDVDLIERAFRHLIPYAEWTSNVMSLHFSELPEDLQETILSGMEFIPIGGSDIVIVKSAELISGLGEWIFGQLTEEELEELKAEAETKIFMPVFIFIFDSEAYVDQYGLAGVAAPSPADPSIPCCTIIASSIDDVFITGEGLTVLTIHETAHILGLAHPHDGYRPDTGDFVDWFYDWSYTPLTYGSPAANGCGLVEEFCGMIIFEFGRFNFDAIDRGLVLSLVGEAQLNVYDAMLLLDDLGYDSSNLPAEIEASLSSIESDVQESQQHFSSMNYFNHVTFGGISSLMNPMDDAFDFALRAFNTSQQLVKDANALPKSAMIEEPEKKLDISVTVKQKKKVTLISVKNNDELPLFGVKLKMEDGSIKFVKARGWDRDRIDQSTVMVGTDNRPITAGTSMIIILITDNQTISLEWSALSKAGNEIAKGIASTRLS